MLVWLKEWDRCRKEGEYIYVTPQTSRKQVSWVPSAPAQWWSAHWEFTTQFPHRGGGGVTTKLLSNVADSFTAIFQLRSEAVTLTDSTEFSLFFWEKKKIIFPSRCINNVQSCNMTKHAHRHTHPHTLDRWWCVRSATGCNIRLKAVEIYLLTLSIVRHPRSHARAFLPRCHTDKLTSDLCEI